MDVLLALPQGRHLDGDGVQAVVQVLAEGALLDRQQHVHVGGGHYAHIGLLGLAAAHADELTRLQHAQQAHLRGEGQFAHFIQEDGAAISHLEVAFAGLVSTGE